MKKKGYTQNKREFQEMIRAVKPFIHLFIHSTNNLSSAYYTPGTVLDAQNSLSWASVGSPHGEQDRTSHWRQETSE